MPEGVRVGHRSRFNCYILVMRPEPRSSVNGAGENPCGSLSGVMVFVVMWQLSFSQTRIAAREQRHDIPPLRDQHQLLAISLCYDGPWTNY